MPFILSIGDFTFGTAFGTPTSIDGLTPAVAPPFGDITRIGKTAFPTDETFLLQGIPFPGQWILSDMSMHFGWQEQKGWGLNGAFVIPTGQPLRRMKFEGLLWTEAQAHTYNLIRRKYLVDLATSSAIVPLPPGPAPVLPPVMVPFKQLSPIPDNVIAAPTTQKLTTARPFTLHHSEVNRNGITSVVVLEYAALKNEGGGAWRGSIEFLQFRTPKTAPSRPTQNIDGTGVTQAKPITPQQILNQQLADQNATQNAARAARARALRGG